MLLVNLQKIIQNIKMVNLYQIVLIIKRVINYFQLIVMHICNKKDSYHEFIIYKYIIYTQENKLNITHLTILYI